MTTVDRKEVFIMQKLQGKCGCNTVNKLHWWQKGFLWVGIAAIIALITGIFIRLKKLIG